MHQVLKGNVHAELCCVLYISSMISMMPVLAQLLQLYIKARPAADSSCDVVLT